MPDAYKCSRCQEYYDGKPHFSLFDKDGDLALDLCPECEQAFDAFMDGDQSTVLDDFDMDDPEHEVERSLEPDELGKLHEGGDEV